MPPRSEHSAPIDLNILPQRYRPKVVSPALLLVWGIAVLLLVLVIPLLCAARVGGRRAEESQAALQTAQIELRSMRTPAPQVETLAAQLAQAREDLTILETIQPTAMAPHHDWEAIVATLLTYDPSRIRLTEIDQDIDDLLVRGIAVQREDVLQYAGMLENSGVFEQVLVQSMREASAPFQPSPTSAIQPTLPYTPTATLPPTPTKAPYDAYEIDDFQPRLIMPGEIQWRSFNPVHDIDRAVFTGRAGKRYCTSGADLQDCVNP